MSKHEERLVEIPEDKPKEKRRLSLRDIALPDGLFNQVVKQVVAAVLLTICVVTVAIYTKDPRYLVAISIAVALIYMAVMIVLDYHKGEILEVPLICTSVNSRIRKNATRVVFRTGEEFPTYYEFVLSGHRERDFQANFTYVVYFRKSNPKELLGYTPL